jgi:hypothetical protein
MPYIFLNLGPFLYILIEWAKKNDASLAHFVCNHVKMASSAHKRCAVRDIPFPLYIFPFIFVRLLKHFLGLIYVRFLFQFGVDYEFQSDFTPTNLPLYLKKLIGGLFCCGNVGTIVDEG